MNGSAAMPTNTFWWVKRRLSDDEVERVRALELSDDIHGFRPEYRRIYPQGMLAAQVIGMRDVDGVGRGGIEEGCEATLKGQPGRRTLTRDARGRVIDITADESRPLRDGESVVLAIDSVPANLCGNAARPVDVRVQARELLCDRARPAVR